MVPCQQIPYYPLALTMVPCWPVPYPLALTTVPHQPVLYDPFTLTNILLASPLQSPRMDGPLSASPLLSLTMRMVPQPVPYHLFALTWVPRWAVSCHPLTLLVPCLPVPYYPLIHNSPSASILRSPHINDPSASPPQSLRTDDSHFLASSLPSPCIDGPLSASHHHPLETMVLHQPVPF